MGRSLNSRPGIWITFRCEACKDLKLAVSGDHYQSVDAAFQRSKELGWTSIAARGAVDGGVLCPSCSKALRN